MKKMGLHKLIDPQSPHYDKGEKNGIEILEDEMTISEIRGFCYGNKRKYEIRLEHKGQRESDLKKIKHYENYLDVLTNLQFEIGITDCMIVSRAFKLAEMEWDYH